MLYDLSFLEKGKPWPPMSEVERLNDYIANRKLFKGKQFVEYVQQFRRIERVVGQYFNIESYHILLNYHKLVSIKLADLIFSEPPQITVPDDAIQAVLDDIIRTTDLFNTCHSAAIDASMLGDTVLTKSVDENGSALITVNPPDNWFPVVDRMNIKRRLYDVQAWQYPIDQERGVYRLAVIIHRPDGTELQEYSLDTRNGSKTEFLMGGKLAGGRTVTKGEDKMLLVTAHSMVTSDTIFGESDYDMFDSIVSELMIRFAQVSKILDAHSSPTMSGPPLSVEDERGKRKLVAGNYYERQDNNEPPLEYIVWNASLEANFKQIELLLTQLYTLSEMGSSLLGDFSSIKGAVPSGTAMRRLMMSPLAKAARVRNSFDRAIKAILSDALMDLGYTVDESDISIAWNDGLPDDPAEEATIANMRTGGKPTLSQWTAIQRLDKSTPDDTQAELDMIRADDLASSGGLIQDATGAPPGGYGNEPTDVVQNTVTGTDVTVQG